MKQTSVTGYPRIGAGRELKKATEAYFRRELTQADLQTQAAALRRAHWQIQQEAGIGWIPCNDFSFYDTVLDTSVLLGAVPARYRALELDRLDTYFAMAKGYQGTHGDVHALPMRKWFNTNYHYIVPELEADMALSAASEHPFAAFAEAKALGITAKPVLVGPFTYLMLAENRSGRTLEALADMIAPIYAALLARFAALGAGWVQMDEPFLVTDQTEETLALFERLYRPLLAAPARPRLLLQTYFGDVRDSYARLCALGFDALGLDFCEGETENLRSVETHGLPQGTLLAAGVVNGKNIWVNDYDRSLTLLHRLEQHMQPAQIVVSTSCSLLHVPYTVQNEPALAEPYREQMAFAQEKLGELADLTRLCDSPAVENDAALLRNRAVRARKESAAFRFDDVRAAASGLKDSDFIRSPAFETRRAVQKKALGLPLLPTTTIGSFPQTAEVRALRRQFKQGKLTAEAYTAAIRAKTAEVIALQEQIGLDVLVHGEYERNDMVEYFGEKLSGFLFTQNAWVQSYGTRCVKPPIIFGDVRRDAPMTVEAITYAQSLTEKPVKGMLTGPVTILNWSFAREDLPPREIALQIALAIRAEVLDLEKAGVRIIQIDEAALREKLPLRRCDWHRAYLDWAIPVFRLVHAGVRPETQIHTHMCYSKFEDIIRDIDDMDADVITFEAAKSDLSLLDVLRDSHFRTEVGPGVYDIHSPRVPDESELVEMIRAIVVKLDAHRVWVNPDCGLKTRGMAETVPSLTNMVHAAHTVRAQLEANA